MSEKLTYEELEQRVLELEKAYLERRQMEDALRMVVWPVCFVTE